MATIISDSKLQTLETEFSFFRLLTFRLLLYDIIFDSQFELILDPIDQFLSLLAITWDVDSLEHLLVSPDHLQITRYLNIEILKSFVIGDCVQGFTD